MFPRTRSQLAYTSANGKSGSVLIESEVETASMISSPQVDISAFSELLPMVPSTEAQENEGGRCDVANG